jgi:hypothetical protein
MEHANFVSSAPIHARFNECKPQRFDVVQTTDYKTDRVGIVDEEYDRFIKQLRRAKRVQIEATFFQEGTRVFEFDVEGLSSEWVSEPKREARPKSAREAAWEVLL